MPKNLLIWPRIILLFQEPSLYVACYAVLVQARPLVWLISKVALIIVPTTLPAVFVFFFLSRCPTWLVMITALLMD